MATTATTRPDTGSSTWLLAGLLAGAGIIHASVILNHQDETALAAGFALVAWFQIGTAYLVLRSPRSQALLAAVVVGNLAVLGAWALSRTTGLPFDLHGGVASSAGRLDIVAAALAAGAIVLALGALLSGRHVSAPMSIAGAGAVLGLATMAMVLPEGGSSVPTIDGSGQAAAGGHDHGGGHGHGGGEMAAVGADDHAGQMLAIDRARCDLAFNPQAYWDETRAMGIDTYAGGAMEAHGGSSLTEVAAHLPMAGRGSEVFDQLLSLSSLAESESAAAVFIAELADATEAEYEAYRTWYRQNMAGHGHGHDEMAGGDTDSATPHMGHVEPQPWKAMVDQDACDQLAEELELARETALTYPTVADATAAGWTRVTPYLPGIGAHYMNFSYVDSTFEIDKPEMILYDGTSPESRVIGLSYYIVLGGSVQPSQGFTGDNDHYHRHLGLCVGAGGVIGDSTTTEEECAERGGVKADGSEGWMSHAWVVPGCESPWGVFSAVNPLLDQHLGAASGESDGCGGSKAAERYDLSPGRSDLRNGAPISELAGG